MSLSQYDVKTDQALYASADHLRVFEDLTAAQQAVADAKNNAGRIGRSRHTLHSVGMGNNRLLAPLTFQLTFASQPTFTSGVVLQSPPVATALPLATTGVYRWVTDDRGYFTGAYVYVAVTTVIGITLENLPPAARGYVLEHHLCFEGPAFRDVNYDAISKDS